MEHKTITEFQLVDINRLVPYINNARTHSPEQINKLRASLREFGFVNPIIVDRDYNVLAGHGRLIGAKAEGYKEVPCVFVDEMTEAQKKAYIIADNRMAMDAGWDEELLRVERDSTDPETFRLLLRDTKVNLVCTDAPYFVKLESQSGRIANDDLEDAQAYEFLMKAFTNFKDAMAIDASIYEFYATMKARVFYDAFEDAGFKVGAGLIWKKPRAPLMRTDWKFNMEPIIFGWRKDGKHKWYGDQKQKAVFEFDGIKNSKEDGHGHPSSKPVPLIAYLIQQSTQVNGIVLDGFLGSASTLIACDQIGRICYGVELEPKFVDVAVMRYMNQHGNSADGVLLIRDGKEHTYEQALDMAEVIADE